MSYRVRCQRSGVSGRRQSRHAFTIVELLVSLGIITIMTGLLLANFQGGNQTSEVRFAAEVLTNQMREIRTGALAGRLIAACSGGTNDKKVCGPGVNIDCSLGLGAGCLKRIPDGYGIRLAANNDKSYTVFYDTNNDNLFTAGEAISTQPFVSTGTVIMLSSVPAAPLDIVFRPPSGEVYINGSTAAASAVITLKHAKRPIQRNVSVFRVTGKIEHD